MTDDEVVTHQDVLDRLPHDVQRDLTMALPPEQRGWWTADEIADQPGEWIEVTDLGSPVTQYIRGQRA